jgi:hypothetical protein
MLLKWEKPASHTSATHQRRVWVNSNYPSKFLGRLVSSPLSAAAAAAVAAKVAGGGAACCCVVGRGALVSVRLGWLYLHMLPNLHMAYWL